jgi:PTS system nitrogen regulatory IIA component
MVIIETLVLVLALLFPLQFTFFYDSQTDSKAEIQVHFQNHIIALAKVLVMTEQQFDFSTTPRIFFAKEFSSKKKAIETLASILAEQSEHSLIDILEAFMNRERLGSTAIGNGIAIPHGRIEGLEKALGVLLIIENGLDIETSDQIPVDILFGLILPEECCDQHLSLLKEIASVASVAKNLEMIRQQKSITKIYQWLRDNNPKLGEILE